MQRNGKASTIYMVSMCSSMAGVTAMAATGVANTLSKVINVTSSLRNSLEQTTLLRHWKVRVRAISICIIAQAHVVSKSLRDALIASTHHWVCAVDSTHPACNDARPQASHNMAAMHILQSGTAGVPESQVGGGIIESGKDPLHTRINACRPVHVIPGSGSGQEGAHW
jgi:hypothetical protein